MPRLARVCRICSKDISVYRRDVYCAPCRAKYRDQQPVAKPGCFTRDEWEGNERTSTPALKEDYRYSPCRDCEPSYRFSTAREGRCDLYEVSPEGNLMQLISEDTMRELMEMEVPED